MDAELRAHERVTQEDSARDARGRRYGTIVVVGGGCYGSYYVRQLARGADAGALAWERLVVVDRDPECRVARARAAAVARGGADGADAGSGAPAHHLAALRLEIADWAEFFGEYLARAAADPTGAERDAIVPSPLMPHLMYDWLLERVRERAAGRDVRTVPLGRAPAVPWQRAAADGGHFVSFAEWMCPINCVEPRNCPEIRAPRSWSMPVAMREYVEAEREAGRGIRGPFLMRCLHRAYGVGMFDTSEVLAADSALGAIAAEGVSARALVGTVSHCHGALNLLQIGGA